MTQNDPLDGLNDPQRKAACEDGPVLVLAGAGTGKTTMIVGRVARLVGEGAAPSRILATTFTNKAGAELKDRVAARLIRRRADGRVDPFGPKVNLSAGTFHATSLRLLRERPALAGLEIGFSIADENQARAILRLVIDDNPSLGMFDDGTAIAETVKDIAAELLGPIARLKERVLMPKEALQSAFDADDPAMLAAARAYAPYQALLRQEKMADFSDLLLWPTIGMIEDDGLRAHWSGYWDHHMVDEYQDTNPLQHTWLKLLVGSGRNLCAVGDDDQAIYRFAGAEVEFIIEFERDFPGATVVRLEDNYRCSGSILEAANAVIAENVERRGKTLRAASERGEPVDVVTITSAWAEARLCAMKACDLLTDDSASSLFVLYRANWQSRMIEEAMIDADVRYRLHGDVGFYGREEVMDGLALLSLVHDGTDREAFMRVVNNPARGVGAVTLHMILESVPEGQDIVSASKDVEGLSPRAQEGLNRFCEIIDETREDHATDASSALGFLLYETGYIKMWEQSVDANAEAKVRNLEELTIAAEGRAPEAFIARAVMARDMIDDDAPVALMTLHASKGLEADWVILAGWEELTFPTKRAIEAENEGDFRAMEDERRLAYVGITRAKAQCMIVTGAMCRFVDALPPTAAAHRSYDVPRPVKVQAAE